MILNFRYRSGYFLPAVDRTAPGGRRSAVEFEHGVNQYADNDGRPDDKGGGEPGTDSTDAIKASNRGHLQQHAKPGQDGHPLP